MVGRRTFPEQNDRTMRTLFLFILLMGLFGPATFAQGDVPSNGADGLVTVRVDDLDDAGLGRISARIAKEQQVSLEYTCLRSGIVVLHFQALQVSERADVITVVKRLFQQAGITGVIDFLDIHVERSALNKC